MNGFAGRLLLIQRQRAARIDYSSSVQQLKPAMPIPGSGSVGARRKATRAKRATERDTRLNHQSAAVQENEPVELILFSVRNKDLAQDSGGNETKNVTAR